MMITDSGLLFLGHPVYRPEIICTLVVTLCSIALFIVLGSVVVRSGQYKPLQLINFYLQHTVHMQFFSMSVLLNAGTLFPACWLQLLNTFQAYC